MTTPPPVGYARTLKGGEAALQSALAVNSRDSSRISSAGAFVKEQSYKLQNVTWGKSKVKDANGSVKTLAVAAKASRPVTDAAQKVFSGPDLNTMLASVAASPILSRAARSLSPCLQARSRLSKTSCAAFKQRGSVKELRHVER